MTLSRLIIIDKLGVVGARPLHLAAARPFRRLKAPLGLSLFRFAPQTRIFVILRYLQYSCNQYFPL